MSISILAIDDDESMCELIESGLTQQDMRVDWRTSLAEGRALLEEGDYDVVLTDLNLGNESGLDLCARLYESRPDIPVIVITAFGDMKSAIAAIRAGAYDFINKPFDMTALAHAVRRAGQHKALSDQVKRLTAEVSAKTHVGKLVGDSPAMRRAYDLISRVSDSDASVIVTGESGTGKELVARALHTESGRAEQPFVAINCAAVPAHLLESELFGHARGAFTDAKTSRKGLFAEAGEGTIFLDEIGEIPIEMQPKLLRVLQERTVRAVGSDREVPFGARVIAATNRDLEAEVEEGRFREDLYYRLNVIEIHIPPLRARGNDILLLAQHFLGRYAEQTGKEVNGFAPEAAKKLIEFDWPGNVRQLENTVERAVTLTRYDKITVEDLPERIRRFESTQTDVTDVDVAHLPTLAELERRYIERVLRMATGNKTQAAKMLGLDRRTLYRKLERYENETGVSGET